MLEFYSEEDEIYELRENQVRTELLSDAEAYGDERRSPLVHREPARAIDETELMPSEPVTVVLSQKGWVRAAKGHEVDPAGLSYKSGDGYLDHALGRSNQSVVFLDSHGRAYALPAHTLPSARSQGEPLTKRLSPPEQARFQAVLAGDPASRWVLASDAGYGFQVPLQELLSRNRSGKAVLTVPAGSAPLAPAPVPAEAQGAELAVASSDGRLLVFPLDELPEMARGKGNKLIGIPAQRLRERQEIVVAVAVLPAGAGLRVQAGKSGKRLGPSDLEPFRAARGRRGTPLPQGLRRLRGLAPE